MKIKEKKMLRQSNYELLRTVCMIFIVGIHFTTQTAIGTFSLSNGIDYYYAVLIGTAGRFACNTFVIIGAWFLVDKEFKASRILNLWIEIFLYSVSITIVCMILKFENANIITLIQAFFPIMGRPVWFGAEYICLLLLTPFLNKMLMKQNITITKKVLGIFAILIIGCATIFPIEHVTPAFSELTWFCFLYLITGLYKHGQIQVSQFIEKYSGWLFLICYVGLCSIKILADYMQWNILNSLYAYYRVHYEALPGVLCSILLFIYFKNLRITYNRIINRVSESTFAVYVIHQTPAFYRDMWNKLFDINTKIQEYNAIIYSIGVMAVIFAGCTLIDCIRKYICTRYVYKTKMYIILCDRIEKMYC